MCTGRVHHLSTLYGEGSFDESDKSVGPSVIPGIEVAVANRRSKWCRIGVRNLTQIRLPCSEFCVLIIR